MVMQSLPPFHPPLLSHTILSLLTIDFLCDLFDTECLFEFHDFHIPRVMTKGEAIEQFAASMHLVLDLVDKYPHDSLAAHILDVTTQFLPVILMSYSRRDRVRQIVSNDKRFQCGEWKDLWETDVTYLKLSLK